MAWTESRDSPLGFSSQPSRVSGGIGRSARSLRRRGRITKRGPNELRTALVQVVLGMVRLKRRTGAYRIMERYDRLKRVKGSGRSIIATARVLREIIWHMLTKDEGFDEVRMTNPEIRRKATEMQAAAIDAA